MGLVSNEGGFFISFFIFFTEFCLSLPCTGNTKHCNVRQREYPAMTPMQWQLAKSSHWVFHHHPICGSWQNVHSDCSAVILFVAVGKTFTVTVPLSSYSWQLAKRSQWLFCCHPICGSWQNIHSDCSTIILQRIGLKFVVQWKHFLQKPSTHLH